MTPYKPMTPRTSAVIAAMPSIVSANDVWAIDFALMAASVRTFASGRLGFTAHTACSSSRRNPGDWIRSDRTAYDIVRDTYGMSMSRFVAIGQYTIAGGA